MSTPTPKPKRKHLAIKYVGKASHRRHRDGLQQRITTVPRTRHGIKRLKEQTTTETQSLGPFLYPLFNAQILPLITQYLSANTLIGLRSTNKYFKTELCTFDAIDKAVLTISTDRDQEGVRRNYVLSKHVVINASPQYCMQSNCSSLHTLYNVDDAIPRRLISRVQSLTIDIKHGMIDVIDIRSSYINNWNMRSLIIRSTNTHDDRINSYETRLHVSSIMLHSLTEMDVSREILLVSWRNLYPISLPVLTNMKRFRYHKIRQVAEMISHCELFSFISRMTQLQHLDLSNIDLHTPILITDPFDYNFIQMVTLDKMSHHLESLVLFDCRLGISDQKAFTHIIARIPVVGIDIHHYALLDVVLLELLISQAAATDSKRLHTVYIEGLPIIHPIPVHYKISFVSTTHKEFKDKDDIEGYDVPSTWKEIQESAVFFDQTMLNATMRDLHASGVTYDKFVMPDTFPVKPVDALEEARKIGISHIKEIIKPNLYSDRLLM